MSVFIQAVHSHAHTYTRTLVCSRVNISGSRSWTIHFDTKCAGEKDTSRFTDQDRKTFACQDTASSGECFSDHGRISDQGSFSDQGRRTSTCHNTPSSEEYFKWISFGPYRCDQCTWFHFWGCLLVFCFQALGLWKIFLFVTSRWDDYACIRLHDFFEYFKWMAASAWLCS